MLEDVICAVGEVAKTDEVIVIGSNAIHAEFDLLRVLSQGVEHQQESDIRSMIMSQDFDVIVSSDPSKSEEIGGAIGIGSDFHSEFGYYVDGVDFDTATLPLGWMDRCTDLQNENTNHVLGKCLEIFTR